MFDNCDNIEKCEHELVGTTSYYISGKLFEYWNLDPLYVDILKGLDFQEHTNEKIEKYIDILDVVRVAVNLKGILTKDSIYQASGIVQDIGLNEKDFIKVALKVKDQYEDAKEKRK